MNNIEISAIESQLEQSNGYSLVNLKLKEITDTAQLFAKSFSLVDESNNAVPEIALSLFKAPANPSDGWLFLSSQTFDSSSLAPQVTQLSQKEQATGIGLIAGFSVFFENINTPCVIVAEAEFMANALLLAGELSKRNPSQAKDIIVFLEAERFPFMIKPARFWSAEMPDEAIGASSLLEDWGVMNRLATTQMIPGCFDGSLAELFKTWIEKARANNDIDNWQKTLLVKNAEAYTL